MDLQEIKTAVDKVARTFEAYKEANDERIEALKKGDETSAKDLGDKLGRIEVDLNALTDAKKKLDEEAKADRERLEELEARADRPGGPALSKQADEYKQAFEGWVRSGGTSQEHGQKMSSLARAAAERKDVTIGTPAQGGYAVPEQISREIEKLELEMSPVRRLVKVTKVGTSDYKSLVNLGGASAAWAAETDTRTATGTDQFREVQPSWGELYAYPLVSRFSLEDMFFNVASWITEAVSEQFAIAEGQAVISGNGTSKPTGMLNTTPVTTADHASPLRAPAAYQYIACDTDTDGSPATPGLRGDSLLELVYTLNKKYRPGSSWVMNSLTTAAVRKLKDSDGVYLWRPGLEAGEPDRLLGYAHETWEDMPDVAANAFPVGFGNFKRAYEMIDIHGLTMVRDEVTRPGYVKFYIARRVGGKPTNNDALKFLRTIQ